MHPEEVRLLLQKQRLQLRIAEQRAHCVALLHEVEGVADGVDQVRGLGARVLALLREHAALAGAVAGVLVLWRPRRALRWVRRGWLLWSGLRRGGGRLRTFVQLASRLAGL